MPVPRWDLIDLRHYVTMSVQFSRGCPFDCEFCDIVVMNGRVPRTKSPRNWLPNSNNCVFADGRTWSSSSMTISSAINAGQSIAARNHRVAYTHPHHDGFLTEASANLADDPELCELMVRAGFKKVFVGFETPSTESLHECGKLQNCRSDLAESVKILQQAGLEVMGGFIVGFDSDPIDIFKRQFEFIQRSGVVTAMVGLLTALPETRLYRRLMQEGRLETETTGNNTQAALNFRPILSREFLITGYRELMKKLYEPRHYYQRIRSSWSTNGPVSQLGRISRSDLEAFLKSLWLLGVWHRGRLRLLAILHRDTPQTTTSVPSRPRTGHHRPSLPPRGQVAVTQPLSKRCFTFASR